MGGRVKGAGGMGKGGEHGGGRGEGGWGGGGCLSNGSFIPSVGADNHD